MAVIRDTAVNPDPRIWVCDSMCYRLRDEFIAEDTRQALDDYQDAAKKRIHSKIKYYGDLYNKLYRRDVSAATALRRIAADISDGFDNLTAEQVLSIYLAFREALRKS